MRPFGWLAASALILAACGAAAPATNASAPLATRGTPGQTAPAATTTAQAAAFMTLSLTDVRSGERFTLSDFKGKVTIVEGMAVW